MSLTFNVSAAADLNPYVFGAGWDVISGSFKIQSGALLPVTDAAPSMAIASNPPTSGLLDGTWTTNHGDGLYTDNDGVIFSNPSGNGYIAFFNGDRLYLYSMTAFSEVDYQIHAVLAYADGDQFRVTYDLDTNTIMAYQLSVSAVVPIWTKTAAIPSVGMSNGIVVRKNNSGTAGIRAATVSAGAATSVSLATPVRVGGTGYSATTVGLGAVTSLTNATITGTSANAFDYSMNPFVNGVAYLPMGSQTQPASDGTLTANGTSTIQTMTGYSYVEATDPVDTGEFSLGKDESFVDGVVVHWPTAAGTINSDMTLTDFVFGTYACWQRDTDGIMHSFTLTVAETGVSIGGLLTSSAMTSHALTSRNVTRAM